MDGWIDGYIPYHIWVSLASKGLKKPLIYKHPLNHNASAQMKEYIYSKSVCCTHLNLNITLICFPV